MNSRQPCKSGKDIDCLDTLFKALKENLRKIEIHEIKTGDFVNMKKKLKAVMLYHLKEQCKCIRKYKYINQNIHHLSS